MANAQLNLIISLRDQASSALEGIQGTLEGLGSTLGDISKNAVAFAAGGLLQSGIEQIGSSFIAAGAAGFSFNSSMENVTAQLNAFTKDGAVTADILEMIKTRAAQTPFEFDAMAQAAAALLPAAKASGQGLEDLIAQAEILAASNPAEGLEGAAFALKEALSGDFASIIERFNLPRQRLNELKEQGVPAMEAVSIAMREMGLDADLVTNLAGTMSGRMSTLQDSLTNIASTATQPIFTFLSESLARLQPVIDANMPALQAFAGALGGAVASAIQNFVAWIAPAAKAVAQFAMALATSGNPLQTFFQLLEQAIPGLGQFVQAAYTYGSQLVAQFGQGMVAAFGYIVNVMRQIGSVIASWLQPNSPPKITPDLDKWGLQAAQLYVDSWSQADFSSLQTLGQGIEEALRSLVDIGALSEQDVIPTLLGSQSAIADAINQMREVGDVSEESIQRIIDSAGAAGSSIGGFVRAYFELQEATEGVARAQEELNAVTAEYDAKLAPLTGKLDEIQQQKRAVDDQIRIKKLQEDIAGGKLDELETQRAQLEIAEIQQRQIVDTAQKEKDAAVDVAQEKLDAAKLQEQQAKAVFDAQQAQLQTSAKQNELLGQQAQLLERIAEQAAAAASAGGGGGGGGGIGGIGGGISIPEIAAPTMPEIDTTSIDNAKQSFYDFKEAQADAASGALDSINPFAQLQSTISGISDPIQTAAVTFATIGTAVTTAMGFVLQFGPTFQLLRGIIEAALPPITAIVQSVFGIIASFLQQNGAQMLSDVGAIWNQVQSIINTVLALIQATLVPYLNQWVVYFQTYGGQIQNAMAGAWQIITGIISGALGIIQGILSATLAAINGDWMGVWQGLSAATDSLVNGITSIIEGALGIITALFGTTVSELESVWSQNWENLKALTLGAVAAIQLAAKAVGTAIIDGIKNGISAGVDALRNMVTEAAQSALDAAKDALGIQSPSRVMADEVGLPISEGMAEGILNGIDVVRNATKKLSDDMLRDLETMAKKAQDILTEVLESTGNLARGRAGATAALRDLMPDDSKVKSLREKEAKLQEEMARARADMQSTNPEKQAQAAERLLEIQRELAAVTEERAKAEQLYGNLAYYAKQAQEEMAKALAESRTMDAAVADDYFKMRSAQILELAKLQEEWREAETEEERKSIEAQIRLIKEAQAVEKQLFEQRVQEQAASNGELLEQLRELLKKLKITLPAGTIPGFANGTSFAPGGLAVLGERGPELVHLPRGSRVDTATETRRLLSAGSGITINVYAAPGQNTEQIADAVSRKIGRATDRRTR